jgi:antitoxin VapB
MVYIDQESKPMAKTAKLFRNGRSQAVRLPAEFRFEGGEVFIRKDEKTGEVILSQRPSSWKEFFRLRDAAIQADPRATEEFLAGRRDLPPQERELFEK